MLSWDGVSLSAKFDNIMPELLPDAKPLELPKKETDEYREFLVDQLSSKNPKNIIVAKGITLISNNNCRPDSLYFDSVKDVYMKLNKKYWEE